jgi:very-short-patch-repair endonuclease
MNNSVTCQICKQKMKDLTSHIFYKHGIKAEKYKSMFPNMPIRCESLLKQQSERIKGNKNPAYQHGGKYSPFSLNFINGTEKVEETKRKAKENKTRDRDNTQIEYWLKKTNGNLNEAQKLLSQRQSTFSLKSCIKKYGEENGTKIWLDRQEKWHKNYKKSNFSKISQELFWQITEKLDSLDAIYFAELNENKQKDDSGINNEFRLRLDKKMILPDFIDVSTKKIIEFDGTYWHKVKNKDYNFNSNPDVKKEKMLVESGYTVLRIDEKEYKNNKQGTIEKCLNFLKS